MEAGTIVLLALALLFLGGFIYLLWKERKREQNQVADVPILSRDGNRRLKNKK
jgi:cbb3-type cytochrome oxidase subunit 3